ncbi:dermonecrotic toxin domain-containing protein [Pseudomonas kitaguniensis]|uniref:dermonecrotic toxin domain-containing protein n=1 Tax=Pseudomonas kitaguniensis TaxID=2607908 RepID=UPI003CFBD9C5
MSLSAANTTPRFIPTSPADLTLGASRATHDAPALAVTSPPPQKSDGRDNPRWAAQYETWKKRSFGKPATWKDAHIPAHLKVFREHDKTVQSDAGIKAYSSMNFVSMPQTRESTRQQIETYYKENKGLDIDPDKTYLMTFAYNERGNTPPYPGTVVSKISLTDAAIKNMQDTPGHEALPIHSFNKYEPTPPPIELVENMTVGYSSSSGRHAYQNSSAALHTQQYEGIYFEPPAEELYDASNQVPLAPESFRKYVWDTSFNTAYKAGLDSFWSANKDTYTTLSKMAFTTAAEKQYTEGSLSLKGRDMATKVANIPAGIALDSLTASDFQHAFSQDLGLQVKELTFEGRVASGIFYITDKTTQKTLLYMTGNSSPLHEFDSPKMMRKWLTDSMSDGPKRLQFAEYFKLHDRFESVWEAGIDTHLEKTGLFSSQHTDWLENRPFGGNSLEGDPFKSLQARVEEYTYQNANSTYVSNADSNKTKVLKELKSVSKSLIILAPIGLAVPQVGMAILLVNLGIAATEIGLGIDDLTKRRPGAADRITFGAFNAIAVIGREGAGRLIAPVVLPAIESSILSKVIPQINPPL